MVSVNYFCCPAVLIVVDRAPGDSAGERCLAGLTRSDNGDDVSVAERGANPRLGVLWYELAKV